LDRTRRDINTTNIPEEFKFDNTVEETMFTKCMKDGQTMCIPLVKAGGQTWRGVNKPEGEV
jgi:hypothetical protein